MQNNLITDRPIIFFDLETTGTNIQNDRIVEISTKVVDKPGNLIQLLQVISSTGANVVSIHHAREDRHSDVSECMVTMVLETIDQAHIHQIERKLQANGYHLAKR